MYTIHIPHNYIFTIYIHTIHTCLLHTCVYTHKHTHTIYLYIYIYRYRYMQLYIHYVHAWYTHIIHIWTLHISTHTQHKHIHTHFWKFIFWLLQHVHNWKQPGVCEREVCVFILGRNWHYSFMPVLLEYWVAFRWMYGLSSSSEWYLSQLNFDWILAKTRYWIN